MTRVAATFLEGAKTTEKWEDSAVWRSRVHAKISVIRSQQNSNKSDMSQIFYGSLSEE